MALTAGIVGLPNVGKSTLFNAITKAGAEMANYPFATIDPNVGMVEVPDKRLARIDELIPAKKIIHTTFEFTDIAGIVKGASKGEGLGNKFLENIRQVDAIVHVVRAFDDDNITSVTGKVDPLEDMATINMELAIADLDSVNKRYAKVEKVARTQTNDKEAQAEFKVLQKIKPVLENGGMVRSIDFDKDEQKIVKGLFLLTSKPVLYVLILPKKRWLIRIQSTMLSKLKPKPLKKVPKLSPFPPRLKKKLRSWTMTKKLTFWQRKAWMNLASIS